MTFKTNNTVLIFHKHMYFVLQYDLDYFHASTLTF